MRGSVALLLALLVTACPSSGPSGTAIDAAAELGETTATVGPEGGTIALGQMTLTIPPGALPAATEIRVARLRPEAVLPAGQTEIEPLSDVYRFTPEGLEFSPPATVRFEAPAGTDPATTFVLWSEGTDFAIALPSPSGDPWSAEVIHFSDGIIARLAKVIGQYCNAVDEGGLGEPCCLRLCRTGLECVGGVCEGHPCPGCILPDGYCYRGYTDRLCGRNGSLCLECTGGATCDDQQCVGGEPECPAGPNGEVLTRTDCGCIDESRLDCCHAVSPPQTIDQGTPCCATRLLCQPNEYYTGDAVLTPYNQCCVGFFDIPSCTTGFNNVEQVNSTGAAQDYNCNPVARYRICVDGNRTCQRSSQ